MFSGFFTGFFLGLSLIVAIGAQNAFVLRQGILKNHIFYIVLFCSISDTLLILIGVIGISHFLNDLINEYSKIIFCFAALWLFIYGILRLKSGISLNSEIIANNAMPSSLANAISIAAIFTFANPHVYLDTMILIGSISQQFDDLNRIYFVAGSCTASFVWFFSLGYAAQLLAPVIKNPNNLRALDLVIALIMFTIASNLVIHSNLF